MYNTFSSHNGKSLGTRAATVS